MKHYVVIKYEAPIKGVYTEFFIEHEDVEILMLKPDFYRDKRKYTLELIKECADIRRHYKLEDVQNITINYIQR